MDRPTPTITFPKTNASTHRLDNGLEIILLEDHSAPLVSVQGWVRTGSLYEDRLLGSGVSHLVEHMVFKGAGGRGPTELAQAVQETGGYLNAYTSFERTVYWIDTLKEGLATAVDAISALTTEASFPEDEYEREKDVIRREMDMGKDDPGRMLGQLMFSTVFRHHPYREPVIGRLELFNLVTRAEALGYYQERYIPDRMFMVVVGDMNPAETLQMIEQRLGAKENRHCPPILLPEEPEQTSRRDAHIEFATELTKLELAWRIPDLLHPDTPALEVLGVLLGQGRGSRLYRRLREKLRLAHEIGAGAYTPTQGGIFYVSAELDPDKREAAEAAVLEEIERVKQDGIAEAEVVRARRIFLSEQISTLTTMRGQASDLASNWLCAHNLDFTRDYLTAIDTVTPEQVQAVARKYLADRSLSSISLSPKGSLGRKSLTIISQRPEETQRHVFDNGMTLLVRENPRLPLVTAHAVLRGGTLAETPANSGISRLMARTIFKGAGKRSGDEIVDLFENAGGSIGADCGGSTFTLTAGFLAPELPLSLELWASCLREPWFDAEIVAQEKERQIAALKSEEDNLLFVAFRSLRQMIYGSHPFSLNRNGSVESLASLTDADLKDFHRRQTLAGNLVVSLGGAVQFEEMRDVLGEKLATLAAGPKQIPQDLAALPESAGKSETIHRPDKKQAVLAVAFPTVDLAHTDRLPLDLLDEACSDMGSRLFVRIREELGLAYSVGSTQILGMAPGVFAFFLSTDPAQLAVAQEELQKEIAKLATDGLKPDELDRARKTWTGKLAMQSQSNSSYAMQSALDEIYGFGHDHHRRMLERVQSLPLAAVNEAAARYFSAARAVTAIVQP